MKKEINIIIANAPLQSGNRGCVALTLATIYLLDRVFSEQGVAFNIYLPDAQIKSWDFHDSCNINGKEYHIKAIDYDVPFSKKTYIECLIKKIIRFFRGEKQKINYFKKADFILNIAQGDSFTDIYGKERFYMINRAYEIARYYSLPYFILPQTIGPFSDKEIEEEAKKTIRNAELVMVRDKQSFDYTKKMVPSSHVKEYIDVAFFLPYTKIIQPSNRIHVGLNISALLWNGGYTRNNQFGLKCDYKDLINSIINYFISVPDVMIHLIPHVVEPDSGVENDYEVCYELWKKYCSDKIVLAPFALTPVDIKSYIAGLDFFIGARMHATIAAFSSGVPVVPLSYSRKFNGLFEETLNYPYTIDMKMMDDKDILKAVKVFFDDRQELQSIIEGRMNGVVKERKKLLHDDFQKLLR